MNITCKPIKEVFKSKDSDFRVLSCVAVGLPPNELALNKWGNFTLSGSNLHPFNLYQEYSLDIIPEQKSKYEASYIVAGFQGIEVGKDITVDPKIEFKFLKSIMTEGQATNVNTAYPNFIELILNNRENEIDYDKISNVGAVYLEKYIEKIKASYKSILFMSVANEWKIEGDKKIEKLTQEFVTPDEACQALQTNPYRVLVDVVEYKFDTADKKIIEKMPEMISSKERCGYGCLKILRDNESEGGDTKINVHTLSRLVKDIVPEAYQHIFEAVSNNDLIYYDTKTKNVSIKNTYDNERFIAQEILKRVKKKENFGMEWEKFREVDGFKCTDEQAEILKLANENNIMLLTGSAGSGKSTAMVCLIRMLEHYMKSYTILAPTGVASKRIASTTGRTASTIHMFLARLGDSYCQSEYIIIDEFSMVGVELFANLLSTIPNSKIILIGDEAQLASISCGNILYDIICSNIVPRANLTKVFRYGIGGISTVATDIREGRPYLDETGNPTFHVQVDDYNFINITNKMENVIPQILETYEELLNKGYDKTDIMVLSPQNIGLVGAYKINEAIQTRFNNHVYTDVSYERQTKEGKIKICFKVGDRVVNTHNNYKSPIMEQGDNGLTFTGAETLIANGDIGYIRDCVSDNELGNYLVVQYDEHLIGVVGNAIEDLLLGYAISIHKSQGSQSKAVLLVTHKSQKKMLKRNILYVGTSRAQEYLVQIGDVNSISCGLEDEEQKNRDTWLQDLLKEEN